VKKPKLSIRVFHFSDYCAYLKAAYDELCGHDPSVSFRKLQKVAGYSETSNHLWMRMHGHAPLSQQAAQRYARVFGLKTREIQFFMLLAAMNQAKTDEDRNAYLEQMMEFREFRESRINNPADYYSPWYLPILRATVGLDDFKEDPAWIAERLLMPITKKEVEKGLQKLFAIGYLVRDERGSLRLSSPFVGAYEDRHDPDPITILNMRNYDRAMIELAHNAVGKQPQSQKFIVGNTLHISRRQALAMRDIVRKCLREIEALASKDEAVEVVYRVNMQLFSLSKWTDEEQK